MFDKYDIFYGISKHTKEKTIYWLYSLVFCLVLLFTFKNKVGFLQLNFAFTPKELTLFALSLFLFGLAAYFFILFFRIHQDVRHFKTNQKKFFIQSRILNNYQKEKILKKIFIRRELYTIIIKPDEKRRYTLSPKQWRFYAKKIGERNQIFSKMKFLLYLENKIDNDEPLKDKEIEYLNEMLFSEEDLYLFNKIKKDLSK